MSNLAYAFNDTFTYKDYLSWNTEERYEIIDGIVYIMASPTARHQAISMELAGSIWDFLKGKPDNVASSVLPGLTVNLDTVRANIAA